MKVPYDEVDFVWVENHYDYHLCGLCRYNGELHRFIAHDETQYDLVEAMCPCCMTGGSFERNGHINDVDIWRECNCETYTDLQCDIIPLTFVEKIKWVLEMKWFEFCVGKHWSYSNRKNGEMFMNKRPMMMKLYYKMRGWI